MDEEVHQEHLAIGDLYFCLIMSKFQVASGDRTNFTQLENTFCTQVPPSKEMCNSGWFQRTIQAL